jgi:hypothetical protein
MGSIRFEELTVAGMVQSRLKRLERGSCRPSSEDCPGGATVLVDADDPTPPLDAARCKLCGGVHVCVVEEVIVSAGDDAEAQESGQ